MNVEAELPRRETPSAGWRSTPRARPLLPVLPIACALGVGAFGLLPITHEIPGLKWSFVGAGATLLGWSAIVFVEARRRARVLTMEIAARPQHYLQACAQALVLMYWGWYWPQVYESAPLILSQLLFAYAFDALLGWSRRDVYTLGFGPFPIIFSINLFLWFKPEWFYLQFALVAAGLAAKELIRWNRDGRVVHIFNPSSFPLAIVSLALILADSAEMTWGGDIARTQFFPPNIHLMLFLVGLPGQFLFGVTPMTMAAALTTYAFGLLYYSMTGTYFFITTYIPAAMFLGMHLLFTDPSTSPRTELGRILFGVLYGAGCIASYALLGALGRPTFYDKLLPVPLLNLSVRWIDRLARSRAASRFDPSAPGAMLPPRRRNLAYISVWGAAFLLMLAAGGVGDVHRGQSVLFWQGACGEGRRNACDTFDGMISSYCREDSAWACNEYGITLIARDGDVGAGVESFRRACSLGLQTGCGNVAAVRTGTRPPLSAPPRASDYPVLLQQGKGPVRERRPLDLYRRACRQGWPSGCDSLATLHLRGEGAPRDVPRALREFEKACDAGWASSCASLGAVYSTGDGVARDPARARAYFTTACQLGLASACDRARSPTSG